MGGTCHMITSGASSTQPCPSREDAAISTLSKARSWGLSTRTDVGVTDAGRWRLAQIRRAYRNLITKEHPDKGGDPEKFALIQRAYDVLSSDAKRRQYDTTGKAEKTADEELLDSFGGGASHVAPAVVHSSP
jgi:hypothetical protein